MHLWIKKQVQSKGRKSVSAGTGVVMLTFKSPAN